MQISPKKETFNLQDCFEQDKEYLNDIEIMKVQKQRLLDDLLKDSEIRTQSPDSGDKSIPRDTSKTKHSKNLINNKQM